jgi:hypothetical protein
MTVTEKELDRAPAGGAKKKKELNNGSEYYHKQLRDFYLKICAGDGRLTRASWEKACGKGKDHEMWRSHAHDDDSDDQVQSSSHEHDVAIVLFQAAYLHDDHEMGFRHARRDRRRGPRG